jgi:2,3-bisphosphoglycerate-dependent phosphoglycerate mutase
MPLGAEFEEAEPTFMGRTIPESVLPAHGIRRISGWLVGVILRMLDRSPRACEIISPVTMVWLIRHAESESNAGLRTSDPATIQLTARGRSQAAHLARSFPSPPALIVTSPYQRAKETALPTCERFPNVPVEEWPVQEFTYLSPARCRHLTAAERAPMVRAYWERADSMFVDGAGAESFVEFLMRVAEARVRLRTLEPGPVAVFTHGGFIRAMLWVERTGMSDVTPAAMRDFHAFLESYPVPNAAITGVQEGALTFTCAICRCERSYDPKHPPDSFVDFFDPDSQTIVHLCDLCFEIEEHERSSAEFAERAAESPYYF